MESGGRDAWLLLDRDSVPPSMEGRVIELGLVRVFPGEIERLLAAREMTLSQEEASIAAFVARGVPISDIARQLHLSRRTVYRRISKLKELVGAGENDDLAAGLIERGF